ncbi:FkbM family methyltransferase [Parabacteroides goldsteinii]|mgnify:CR=1 FL=1|uniref:FkbM family methyltransferase n=1 Tax=Parabacteroides goldsteinii TaxID=328812 RepID=UPI00321A3044
MNEFLLSLEAFSKSICFQEKKMYLTYSEYIIYSVLPQRKYRNSYKDKLMKFPLVSLLAYYRAKKLYYSRLDMKTFYAYKNHLLENCNEYLSLYNSLADEESKRVLVEVLKGRFSGDFRKAMSDSKQYFEEEIIQFKPNEVFVDCGAWVGDSTDMFLKLNPYPATCYIIEPDMLSMACAKRNLSNKEGVFHYIQKGVSDQKELLPFNGNGSSGASFEYIADGSENEMELDIIDHIVQEPTTFIKMDLEGFEMKALLGAKMQISQYHPKLAICIYHKPTDFIEIFKLIKSFDTTDQYKYYIRHYSPMHNETVLYAIPNRQVQ